MAVKMQYSKIPQNPGVYFFKKSGKILYIGKASNLRARLKYYLKPPLSNPVAKLQALLKEAKNLSWEVLNSETEALIREAELIKKYRPKYNVLMRDDKQYFYVGFTHSTSSGQAEKFPKVFVTHQPQTSRLKFPYPYPSLRSGRAPTPRNFIREVSADFIGPFTEGAALKSVLQTLRRAFPYCTCKKPHKRPCLNARIGRCLEFCCLENPENLMSRFAGFADFSAWSPSEAWSEKSKQPSQGRAGGPRMSKVAASGSPEQIYKKNISAIKKILSGKNKSLARELKKEMQKLSKKQKYEEAGKMRNQIYALEKIFEHRGVIKQDLQSESAKALRALESLLKIPEIHRIEAYDIANIGGRFAYGSMAVFIDGISEKDQYRIFKIRGVAESNDPAMIKEVLTRRFKHKEWPFSEVIIIDGGKAQLNASLYALRHKPYASKYTAYSLRHTAIIALTKNKRHVGDHLFISGKKSPILLDHLPQSLKNLILVMDNEAHRFAINYYRKSHRKSLTIQK